LIDILKVSIISIEYYDMLKICKKSRFLKNLKRYKREHKNRLKSEVYIGD
jgi:hypothetical protein